MCMRRFLTNLSFILFGLSGLLGVAVSASYILRGPCRLRQPQFLTAPTAQAALPSQPQAAHPALQNGAANGADVTGAVRPPLPAHDGAVAGTGATGAVAYGPSGGAGAAGYGPRGFELAPSTGGAVRSAPNGGGISANAGAADSTGAGLGSGGRRRRRLHSCAAVERGGWR